MKDSKLLFILLIISIYFNIKKSVKKLPYLLFVATISYYNWPLKFSIWGSRNTIRTARIERVRHDQVIPLPGQSKADTRKTDAPKTLTDYESVDQILQDLRPGVITPQSTINTSQRLLELIFDLQYWTLMQEKDGVEIYTLPFKGLELPMVRGEAYITGPTIEELVSVIQNPIARKSWDPRFDHSKVLKFLDDGLTISHSTQKGTWPAAARDFVVVTDSIVSLTKITTLVSSVPFDHPSEPSVVRGEILLAAWVLEKTTHGIRTSYIVSVDIKGSLPSALIKMVQVQTPLCIKRVKDYLQENGSECYVQGNVVEKEISEGLVRVVIDNECLLWIPKRFGEIKVRGKCKYEVVQGEGLTKVKLKVTVESRNEIIVELRTCEGLDISHSVGEF